MPFREDHCRPLCCASNFFLQLEALAPPGPPRILVSLRVAKPRRFLSALFRSQLLEQFPPPWPSDQSGWNPKALSSDRIEETVYLDRLFSGVGFSQNYVVATHPGFFLPVADPLSPRWCHFPFAPSLYLFSPFASLVHRPTPLRFRNRPSSCGALCSTSAFSGTAPNRTSSSLRLPSLPWVFTVFMRAL